MSKLFISIFTILLFFSCNLMENKEENANENNREIVIDDLDQKGLEWLESIFQCADAQGFCYPDEEKVLSKEYRDYLIFANSIFYEGHDWKEKEKEIYQKTYRDKWEGTYTILEEETWPFDRPNGDIPNLEEVRVQSKGNLNYEVFIDYYQGEFTNTSLVELIEDNGYFYIHKTKTIK